jgi:hypothetical protein
MPVFITTPDLPQQCHVIEQILQKKLLIVSDFDMRRLDDAGFDHFIQTVKKTIASDTSVELIAIDATGDSIRLDDPDVPHNVLLFEHHLSKIAKTVIVTEDYYHWYNPSAKVIYFPWQLWLYSTKSVGKLYGTSNTVYDTKLEKTNAVVCLNRSLHWHRLYLFSWLARQNWFDKISYSFIEPLGDRLDSTYGIKRYLNHDEIQDIKTYGHLLPMRLKEESHYPSYRDHTAWFRGGASVDNAPHSNYALNIVTETSMSEGVVITEKTCKAIMAYQIPVLVGPAGITQFLEDLGLDMFSDIIPWKTWDHEKDHKLRMRQIVEYLHEILHKDTAEQDILHLHASVYDRLRQNKQYFHSEDFENVLTRPMKSCSFYGATN